jgi:hypothetical protein
VATNQVIWATSRWEVATNQVIWATSRWEVATNQVIWVNMTQEAADAIRELRAEGRIIGKPSSLLVYTIDGLTLRLPLVKPKGAYRAPHWLPLTIRPGTGWTTTAAAAQADAGKYRALRKHQHKPEDHRREHRHEAGENQAILFLPVSHHTPRSSGTSLRRQRHVLKHS